MNNKDKGKCKIVFSEHDQLWLVVTPDIDDGSIVKFDYVIIETPEFYTYKEAKEWVRKSKYFRLGRF